MQMNFFQSIVAMQVAGDWTITAPPLSLYLQRRRINLEIARHFCVEVRYRVGEKEYYAIGFKNDSGGYELRNPYFKGGCSPKDITTINNGHYNVCVFEGFFDFLSYKTYYNRLHTIRRENGHPETNYVILNSLAFFEKARGFMETHQRIFLFLDRDTAGQNCSACARALNDKYVDDSNLYNGFQDLNMWLVNNKEELL